MDAGGAHIWHKNCRDVYIIPIELSNAVCEMCMYRCICDAATADLIRVMEGFLLLLKALLEVLWRSNS